MKKIFKRFLAYIIDMLIVYTIIMGLTSIPFLNPSNSKYNTYYHKYVKIYSEYTNFAKDLSDYYQDKDLSNKEYKALISKYSSFKDKMSKYYHDGKLTSSNYKKLSKDISREYEDKYKKINYKLSKCSIVGNIIGALVITGYFMACNILMKGATIGKKIMGLRIVSVQDGSVLNWQYLVRVLILYNPLYYLGVVIASMISDANTFYTSSIILGNIRNYLSAIIMIMVMVRIDNRGLHEILSNTKVIFDDSKVSSNSNGTRLRGRRLKKVIDAKVEDE